jgi:hypothetical protein
MRNNMTPKKNIVQTAAGSAIEQLKMKQAKMGSMLKRGSASQRFHSGIRRRLEGIATTRPVKPQPAQSRRILTDAGREVVKKAVNSGGGASSLGRSLNSAPMSTPIASNIAQNQAPALAQQNAAAAAARNKTLAAIKKV